MPDFQNNFLNALTSGYQFGAQVKQDRDKQQLNAFASQAYSAPPEQRQQIIGQAVGVDADAGLKLGEAIQGDDDRRNRSLSNAAKMLVNTPQAYRPQVYSQMRSGLSKFIPNLPEQYDDTVDQAANAIVSAYGNVGKEDQVQSTRIGADGFYYTVDRAGNWTNSGIKADPKTQVRDVPGLPLGLIDRRAGTVTSIDEGGPSGPPQSDPAIAGSGPNQAAVQIDGIDPATSQRMAQTISLMREAGYPDTEIDSFVQGQASMPRTVSGSQLQNTQPVVDGPAAMRPAVSPAEAERLRLAQEANDRASEAARRADDAARRAADAAQFGAIPTGYRKKQDGSGIEPIPGYVAPSSQKPPTQAELTAKGYHDRMAAAEQDLQATVAAGFDAGNYRDYLTAGQGPMRNWAATDLGQQYRQKQEDWVRAKLRKESGAVIGDDEMEREIRTYFPQPGDGPNVIQKKEGSRAIAIKAMEEAAGRARENAGSAQPTMGTQQADDFSHLWGAQ